MTGGSACTSHGAVEVVDFSTFFDLDVDLLLDFFGSLGLQIFSTSAGRSSGGARATDAISAAVGFTSPERTFWRVPGTASSAASTPLANFSARITVFRAMPFSEAIRSQVRLAFWLLPFC